MFWLLIRIACTASACSALPYGGIAYPTKAECLLQSDIFASRDAAMGRPIGWGCQNLEVIVHGQR